MEYLSNDYKDRLNQHRNSRKLCNKTGHQAVNLIESQWKLKQQHGHNFPMKGKPLQNKYQRQKKETYSKEQDCDNHSLGSEQES